MVTQVLAVKKANQRTIIMAPEKARRVAKAWPDDYDYFELRFASESTVKPVLKPITVVTAKVQVDSISLMNDLGVEIS